MFFKYDYEFLSNFYRCEIEYDGITYQNSEAAFQAQKDLDIEMRKQFAELSPAHAKLKGRNEVKLRSDWEEVKDNIMKEIVFAKFSQNPELKEKLLATGDIYIEETTNWHDNEWGNCICDKCYHKIGKNKLGLILMEIRDYFNGLMDYEELFTSSYYNNHYYEKE